MKLSKQEERLRQELVAELKATSQQVERSFADLLAALAKLPADVNMSIRFYNAALLKAKVFTEAIAEKLREEYDEKSDSWKEGDRGQEADAFISEWESIDWDQIEEVAVLDPELEAKALKLAEALESLPSESQ